MSIDFHLANFPTLCQNHEDTGHQYPDVNAGMDCVPTSIAAALTWFTGTQYYGDEVIDAVYGPTYQGGTAAVNFVDYCAARGVSLFPVDGTPAQLVAAIHSQLHQNRPVLVTVPGQWNNPATSGQNPGAVTHVMVVSGDGAGLIEVMNPWTGAFEEYSDSWFEVKLCYGQIWPMEGHVIPAGWKDDGATLTAPNGQPVRYGFREWVLSHPWNAENVPFAPEYGVDSVEPLVNASTGKGSRQDFYEGSLGYTEARGVFVIWTGCEIEALKAKIAAAAPAPASPVDLSAIAADLSDALAKVQAAIEAATAPASGGAEPTYVVQEGDTLEEIAGRLGVNAHHLYQQNMAAIEAAAQEHGYARGSGSGELLVAGTVLCYS